jgi:hypothetical protein
MTDRVYVREIEGSPVVDMYGARIHVGVDYGAVTIRTFAPITLSAEQRDQLDRLLYAADAEANANVLALKALAEDELQAAAEEALMGT